MQKWAHVLIAVWQIAWVVGCLALAYAVKPETGYAPLPAIVLVLIPFMFLPVIAGYTLYEMRYGRRR